MSSPHHFSQFPTSLTTHSTFIRLKVDRLNVVQVFVLDQNNSHGLPSCPNQREKGKASSQNNSASNEEIMAREGEGEREISVDMKLGVFGSADSV